MKLVELKCKNCNSLLEVDQGSKEVTCKYCNTTFMIDDEIKKTRFIDMEKSGYDFEIGRQKAILESFTKPKDKKKKKKITLWKIISWTIFFPIKLIFLFFKIMDAIFKKHY